MKLPQLEGIELNVILRYANQSGALFNYLYVQDGVSSELKGQSLTSMDDVISAVGSSDIPKITIENDMFYFNKTEFISFIGGKQNFALLISLTIKKLHDVKRYSDTFYFKV